MKVIVSKRKTKKAKIVLNPNCHYQFVKNNVHMHIYNADIKKVYVTL